MATLKQITAIEKTVENGGNVSSAMRNAGYAETTIKNPSNLTRSKAWNELIERDLDNSVAVDALMRNIKRGGQIANASLHMFFKLKDLYPTERHRIELEDDMENLSDEELEEKIHQKQIEMFQHSPDWNKLKDRYEAMYSELKEMEIHLMWGGKVKTKYSEQLNNSKDESKIVDTI